CLEGLTGTCIGSGAVRGQSVGTTYSGIGAGPQPPHPTGPQLPPTPVQPQTALSSWIIYPRAPGCCGPIGRDVPIYGEVYVRSGASFPLDNGVFGNALATGWDIQRGVRALFLNPSREAAWTAYLSCDHIHH